MDFESREVELDEFADEVNVPLPFHISGIFRAAFTLNRVIGNWRHMKLLSTPLKMFRMNIPNTAELETKGDFDINTLTVNVDAKIPPQPVSVYGDANIHGQVVDDDQVHIASGGLDACHNASDDEKHSSVSESALQDILRAAPISVGPFRAKFLLFVICVATSIGRTLSLEVSPQNLVASNGSEACFEVKSDSKPFGILVSGTVIYSSSNGRVHTNVQNALNVYPLNGSFLLCYNPILTEYGKIHSIQVGYEPEFRFHVHVFSDNSCSSNYGGSVQYNLRVTDAEAAEVFLICSGNITKCEKVASYNDRFQCQTAAGGSVVNSCNALYDRCSVMIKAPELVGGASNIAIRSLIHSKPVDVASQLNPVALDATSEVPSSQNMNAVSQSGLQPEILSAVPTASQIHDNSTMSPLADVFHVTTDWQFIVATVAVVFDIIFFCAVVILIITVCCLLRDRRRLVNGHRSENHEMTALRNGAHHSNGV